MFKSADCVAIHLQDITAAENFYTNVMKFTLVNRSETHLEYDTGQLSPLHRPRTQHPAASPELHRARHRRRQIRSRWQTAASSFAKATTPSTSATLSASRTPSSRHSITEANKRRI